MVKLTAERLFARQCAYDEAIDHLRDAAGASPDFLEPFEAEEMRALADRLDAEINRVLATTGRSSAERLRRATPKDPAGV